MLPRKCVATIRVLCKFISIIIFYLVRISISLFNLPVPCFPFLSFIRFFLSTLCLMICFHFYPPSFINILLFLCKIFLYSYSPSLPFSLFPFYSLISHIHFSLLYLPLILLSLSLPPFHQFSFLSPFHQLSSLSLSLLPPFGCCIISIHFLLMQSRFNVA